MICRPAIARRPTSRTRSSVAAAWLAAGLASSLVAGCGTLTSWLPSPPSFGWFSSSKKPGPLPAFETKATPTAAWQVQIGKAGAGFSPVVVGDALYAAARDGTLARIDARTGATAWRINVGKGLSAGVGADANVVAVGTEKGEVLAFDPQGKALWQARISSEVIAPPHVADGIVAVWSVDGRLFGLTATDGKTKWVNSRVNPPLVVRNSAGGTSSRGGLFTGTAGGKLVALDLASGTVGWESSVAVPKGATELERIADVTSLPAIGERQVCAVAFQGRMACFDIVRGVLEWTRDISSLGGIAADDRYFYVTDDAGSVHALDKSTGASVWKQDKLAQRRPGGPQIAGEHLGVVDVEGYLHLLDRTEGTLVARLATDGTPATAQPLRSAERIVWQSEGGTVYAASAR